MKNTALKILFLILVLLGSIMTAQADDAAQQVSGLQVTIQEQKAQLSWDALDGSKSYEVYYSASELSGFRRIGTTSGTTCSISGLNYGSVWYFKIRARLTSGGYSAYSEVVSAEIPVPGISGFHAEVVNGSEVELTWDAISGRANYEIYSSTSESSGFIRTITTGSPYAVISGLSYNTTYYFKIRAQFGASVYSEYSEVLQVTTPTAQVSGLQLSVNAQTARLNWEPLYDAKSYEIYRSLSEASDFTLISTTRGTSYTDLTLSGNTTYYYKVRALLTSGETSEYSETVQADIPVAQVTGLRVSVRGLTAKLNWDSLAGAQSYEIYSSSADSSDFTLIASTASTSYTVSELTNDTTYSFKVRALLASGESSEYCETVSVEVSTLRVSGLQAVVREQSVQLTWNALSDRRYYEIYRSTSADSGFKRIGTTSGTSYWASGLSDGTAYYFKVRALFYSGETSEYSDVVQAVIPTGPVTGLRASVNGQEVVLTWNAPAGCQSYEIWQADSASSEFENIGTTESPSYSVSGLSYGTRYYFKVRALLDSGEYNDYSPVLQVFVPVPQVSGLKAAVSGTTVSLSWTELTDSVSYEIWCSNSASYGFESLGTADSAAYDAAGLSYGKTYYFKVRALLADGGYSSFSATVKAVIPVLQVSGLKAAVSGTTVSLSWTELTDSASYEIWCSNTSSSGFSKIGTADSADYDAAGLNYGTSYYFKVRALMANGAYSNYSTAVKAVIPVLQVSGLKASVSGTTVSLSWTELTDSASYEIWRSSASSSGYSKIGTADSTAYEAAGLSYGKTYYFKVRALMANGAYSNYSTVVKAVIPVLQVSGLKAAVSGTTVSLSWTELADSTSYEIWCLNPASSGFSKIGTADSAAYEAAGLSYGKTYYFKVRALMSNGAYSNYSTAVKAVIPVLQVSGLKAAVSGSTVSLSWTALSGSTSYEIWRSNSASSGFSKIGTADSTAYEAAGLSYGKTYYFKVRALMANGAYSNYSTAVKAAIPVLQVSGLKATVSGTTVSLSWTALSGSTSYEIWRSSSFSSGYSKIGTAQSTSFSASGLSAGTTYYFKVRAQMTAGGTSSYSTAVKAAIPAEPVSGLKAVVSGQSVKLSWTALSGRRTYEIYSSTSASSGFRKIGTTSGTSYTPSGLNCGKTYYFKVRALLKTGKYSGYSSVVKAAVPTVQVSGLQAAISGKSVKLSWTALSGRKTYEIYRSASASSGFKKIGTTRSTSYKVSGLSYGKTYYFKVRALMTGGNYSNYSTAVQTVLSKTRSAAPVISVSGLKAVVSGQSVKLSWSKLSGRKSYEIYRSTSADSGFKKIGKSTDASFQVSGLSTGKTYYFKVRALMKTGKYSEYSSAVKAEIPAVSVSGLKLSVSGQSVNLSWSKLSGRKTYEVYRSTSPDSGFKKIGTTAGTSCKVSGLSYGKSYYFKVRALMKTGESSNFSSCVQAVMPAAPTAVPVVVTKTTAVPITPTAVVTATAIPAAAEPAGEVTEECSEDGGICTVYEKVCTETECTITSKVCAVVGGRKACAEPVVTVVPVLTETPAAIEAAVTATEIPTAAEPTAEVTEECSEDGSSCTVYEKVCTETECTATSRICVVVGDQRACADPVVTVVPVLTETPVQTEETPAEPAVTEEAPAEPAVTEEVPAEPAATEEIPAEPAATEEIPAEPTATEEIPAEPAATEEVPAEPAATEEATAEPAATEETAAEPAATEEATAEPAATEEVPAEPAATEEATAEPAETEEATAEPAATEEATAEPAATEEATAEPAVTEEVPTEPVPTEDLTIREIRIEDLTEETITFSALESYTIQPDKLKVVPEAADWADLTFKLDDESIAEFKTKDIEVIKAEGLTINGLQAGSTTLRIQAGEAEKAVTVVIHLSEAAIQATIEAESAAQAAE